MRARRLLSLGSLALVAAACGQDTGLSGDAVTLRYAFQPGQELIYNTDIAMTMDRPPRGMSASPAASMSRWTWR